MRTRGLRVMLCLGILAAWASTCPCSSHRLNIRQSVGSVLALCCRACDRDGHRHGPAAAACSERRRKAARTSFPSVPIGTYSVTFELANFKKVVRPNIAINSGFNAEVDQKLELGQMSEEVTISAAAPLVDTKKTTTGGTFTAEMMETIPTARDPWQVINMAPGVQAGLNVGGSASGQQVSLATRGTTANVQVEPRGRGDHRPVVEFLAGLLQFRFAGTDPGD